MQAQIDQLLNWVKIFQTRKIYQKDIQNGEVKQRHIDGIIIFQGNVADRPSDGKTEIQAYYAEDEKKLYIWNKTNKAWEHSAFT